MGSVSWNSPASIAPTPRTQIRMYDVPDDRMDHSLESPSGQGFSFTVVRVLKAVEDATNRMGVPAAMASVRSCCASIDGHSALLSPTFTVTPRISGGGHGRKLQ